MFRGISNLNIDAKGRVAIPARYRESIIVNALGQMVITVDHTDRCLLLYPMDQWLKVEQILMSLPKYESQCKKYATLGFRACF